MSQTQDTILICSWLEEESIEPIRRLYPRLRLEHHSGLLPPPRYPSDHTGAPHTRSPADEKKWRTLLAEATILFDFDRGNLENLPSLAPNVRWVQATSAGIGRLMQKHGLAERMPNVVFTTASGVHRRPLAEFVAMSMMMHARRALEMFRAQRSRHWERFAGTDLEGRSLLIVGLGAVGEAVAELACSLGMVVMGIRRDPSGPGGPPATTVHEMHGPEALAELLPRAEYLVLIAPHTSQTAGMIGASQLKLLPAGAALINIGRGALVDQGALVESLQSGHLGGAYLDVFEEEPLPAESPLWGMSNVLVSPHSGSTSDRENQRLTELFCDNLARWQSARPLLNVYDPKRGY